MYNYIRYSLGGINISLMNGNATGLSVSQSSSVDFDSLVVTITNGLNRIVSDIEVTDLVGFYS